MNPSRLLLLIGAILAEVAATLMLRASVVDPIWIPDRKSTRLNSSH